MIFAAGTAQPMGNISGEGLGPFGKSPATSGGVALTQITNTVSAIVGFMTIAAGVWFLFEMLFGGYEWISSSGDAKKLQTARDRLTHGFMGLIIVVGAWAIMAIAGQFFGFDILITKPDVIINSLKLR